MRTGALVLVLAALAATGCGGDERPRVLGQVRLQVLSPPDAAVVEGDEVTLRGRVSPAAAEVKVRGEAAAVRAGAWTADVELDPGANVIDVSASARARRPAVAAIRVVRQVPVEIPDVENDDPQKAAQRLEALGLRVEVTRGGGLLDELLPASLGVCSIDPKPGTEVRVGTTVTLDVAKVC